MPRVRDVADGGAQGLGSPCRVPVCVRLCMGAVYLCVHVCVHEHVCIVCRVHMYMCMCEHVCACVCLFM